MKKKLILIILLLGIPHNKIESFDFGLLSSYALLYGAPLLVNFIFTYPTRMKINQLYTLLAQHYPQLGDPVIRFFVSTLLMRLTLTIGTHLQ